MSNVERLYKDRPVAKRAAKKAAPRARTLMRPKNSTGGQRVSIAKTLTIRMRLSKLSYEGQQKLAALTGYSFGTLHFIATGKTVRMRETTYDVLDNALTSKKWKNMAKKYLIKK